MTRMLSHKSACSSHVLHILVLISSTRLRQTFSALREVDYGPVMSIESASSRGFDSRGGSTSMTLKLSIGLQSKGWEIVTSTPRKMLSFTKGVARERC